MSRMYYLEDRPDSYLFNYSSDIENREWKDWDMSAISTRCISSDISFMDCPMHKFTILNFDAVIAELMNTMRHASVLLQWHGRERLLTTDKKAVYGLDETTVHLWILHGDKMFDSSNFELINLWLCRIRPGTKVYQWNNHIPSRDALNATGTFPDGRGGFIWCVDTWEEVSAWNIRAAWQHWDEEHVKSRSKLQNQHNFMKCTPFRNQ